MRTLKGSSRQAQGPSPGNVDTPATSPVRAMQPVPPLQGFFVSVRSSPGLACPAPSGLNLLLLLHEHGNVGHSYLSAIRIGIAIGIRYRLLTFEARL
jgi:hypothetical protein